MVAAWVVGVLLAVAAAFCAALGDNLVKCSFLREKARLELAGEEERPVYRRPLWVAGIFCMVVLNTSLGLVSYAFADASLTIPFGGLHIVLNLPLAKYLNQEACSTRAICFNMVILAGVLIVLLFGNHSSTYFTAHELFLRLFDPVFMVCTASLALVVLGLLAVMRSPKPMHQRTGLVLFTGILGSVTQVFAKAMSGCLKDGAWTSLFTWFAVVGTISFALTQVYYLNMCLDRYTATFVVPIVNSTIIVVGSLYAAIYFEEMDRWDLQSRLFVPCGILVTSVGIALLSTEPEVEGDEFELPTSVSGDSLGDELENHLVDYAALEESEYDQGQHAGSDGSSEPLEHGHGLVLIP